MFGLEFHVVVMTGDTRGSKGPQGKQPHPGEKLYDSQLPHGFGHSEQVIDYGHKSVVGGFSFDQYTRNVLDKTEKDSPDAQYVEVTSDKVVPVYNEGQDYPKHHPQNGWFAETRIGQ